VALLPRLVTGTWRKDSARPEWAYYVLVSSVVAGLLFSVVAVRPDIVHFIYLQPIFFLLLAWLLDGRNLRGRVAARIAPVLGFCVALYLLSMATALLLRGAGSHYSLSTRRGLVSTPVKDHVIDYIQTHTAPKERILSYPYPSMLYYLTATSSSTSFEYYQYGMHTREQSLDLLSQLKAHPVRVVLYEPGFSDHIHDSWPNTRARDLASDPVADYIAREYQFCVPIDSAAGFHYLFMVRKDFGCPTN
jgi:hypothetical protein